jgi:hypothetical protein
VVSATHEKSRTDRTERSGTKQNKIEECKEEGKKMKYKDKN